MSNKITLLLLVASIFALVAAYVSQYIFGYQPCILCLYQRLPFFAIILLSLFQLFFIKKKFFKKIFFGFNICLLLSNIAIATYHVGVERKVFAGPATCSDNLSEINDLEKLKAAISATKAVRCDEPQFFFLKLSMAAWNLIYCLGLLIVAVFFNKFESLWYRRS